MTKPQLLQITAFADWDQAPLEAAYQIHQLSAQPDLTQIGPQIRAIVTTGGAGVAPAVIKSCPNLELIAVNGVGYDAIDLGLCKSLGVKVSNTPGVLDGDCADLALGMALALTRAIPEADAHARSGAWEQANFPLKRRFFGARAGILGLGRIGMEIARRLEGFGMEIAYSARSAKDVPYRFIQDPVALAEHADFLFVTTLANAETRHIVNAEVLRALGPQGAVINISRAANIDENALLDALEAKTIAGAALDVFEGEPAINPRFKPLKNAVLQPHQGSATEATRRAMGQLQRDNLAAHFAGKPLLTPVEF
jgi:lactate dehydrogenase-like 2-hydroxyacid dehydrogenase